MLNKFGSLWLALECVFVGPWIGLYRYLTVGQIGKTAVPPEEAPLPRSRLLLFQLPFLASLAVVGAWWKLTGPPPVQQYLFELIWFSAGLLGLSLWIRRPVMERVALFGQILILDRYYKILMRYGLQLPIYYDNALLDVDKVLFGRWPVWLGEARSPVEAEFWAMAYSFFLLYLLASLLLSAFGRPRSVAAAYFAGLTLLYAVSYIGYVAVPARGPLALTGVYSTSLPHGVYMVSIQRAMVEQDAVSGAFPSLHVGAVVYMLGADWYLSRDRFYAYLPLGTAIVISTITLRMHYVIDILVGALLALLCLQVCRHMAESAARQVRLKA